MTEQSLFDAILQRDNEREVNAKPYSRLPDDHPDRPRSRNTDPPGSHRAEAEMTASGAMGRQAAQVLSLITRFSGCTSKELGALGTLDRYQIARRCPELRAKQLIYHVENGKEDVRWYPNKEREHVEG